MGTSLTASEVPDTEPPYGNLNIYPSGSISQRTVSVTRAAGGAINQERAQETEVSMSLCCSGGYVMDI